MSQRPINYATPAKRPPRRPVSTAEKWAWIVLGLVAAGVITFVGLLLHYVVRIGPLDSH